MESLLSLTIKAKLFTLLLTMVQDYRRKLTLSNPSFDNGFMHNGLNNSKQPRILNTESERI